MARKKAKALPQPEPEMFTIYGDILQETEDAILVRCEEDEVWLPKSEIEYAGERGDEYVAISLPDWLAEKKGLSDNQGFMPPQDTTPENPVEGQAEAAAEQEPETVTLHGILLSITEDELTFLVRYGDEAGTETEFTLPREEMVSLFDEDTACEQNELVVTVAYAVEAGIIADPGYSDAEEEPAQATGNTPEILRKHPDLKWLAEEQITVTQKLTEAEKAEYADEMAKLDEQIEELEDEIDGLKKSFKKRIDAAESQRRSASKIVREGKEEREILCDKVADYDSAEIKWADAVTGEVVDKRPMTAEERQFPLPIETKGGKKGSAAPEEAPVETTEQEASADAIPEEGAEPADAATDADDALYADAPTPENGEDDAEDSAIPDDMPPKTVTETQASEAVQ